MAFEKTAIVLGSTVKYQMNPNAKRYTLRDNVLLKQMEATSN